jgi:hypothetical protein
MRKVIPKHLVTASEQRTKFNIDVILNVKRHTDKNLRKIFENLRHSQR